MLGPVTPSDQQRKQEKREVVLVSSGAIVSGIRKLGLTSQPKGLPFKQAAAAFTGALSGSATMDVPSQLLFFASLNCEMTEEKLNGA